MKNLLTILMAKTNLMIENPNTLDNIYLFIGLGIISIIVIVLIANKIIKDKKTK